MHVQGSGIASIEQMSVSLRRAVVGGPRITPSAPMRQALPIDVALTVPPTASGQLTVDVTGLTAGQAVASGSGSTSLSSGAHVTVKVTLVAGILPAGEDMAMAVADAGDAATGGGANKTAGTACGVASECQSGFCVDGVCCQSACTDACRACNLAGHAGQCMAAAPGAAPLTGHGSCGPDSPSTCMRNGMCDGNGSCRLYSSSAICKAASCDVASNSFTPDSRCDGAGTCVKPTAITCTPYQCKPDLTACYGSCTDSTQCAAPNTCNLSVTPGSCGPKVNGASCSSGTECNSGRCVDKVCCATDCNTGCVACNLSGNGTCTNVAAGDPDPHGMCGTQAPSTCGTNGKCNGTGGCQKYAAGVTCAAAVCINNAPKTSACDGSGTCVATTGANCSPYGCGNGACYSGECGVYIPPMPPRPGACLAGSICAANCSCHINLPDICDSDVCACP